MAFPKKGDPGYDDMIAKRVAAIKRAKKAKKLKKSSESVGATASPKKRKFKKGWKVRKYVRHQQRVPSTQHLTVSRMIAGNGGTGMEITDTESEEGRVRLATARLLIKQSLELLSSLRSL